MDLASAKIGYFPKSRTLDDPSDRRRFARYARTRALPFEIADPKRDYDLVVLNQRADIGVWSRYRRGNARIVYDATDSYILSTNRDWKALLRGTAKFVTRQSRRLQLNYRKAVEEMCGRADAVICSTEEQREAILKYCANVHVILDMQDEDVQEWKTSYESGRVLRFVWEGLASSGIPWKLLHDIVAPIAERMDVELHVVTDLVYHRYHGTYVRCHSADDARRAFGGLSSRVILHQWSQYSLARIATGCDIALIPIDLGNVFQRGKPENKLLLFWRLGLPTVTSATPAYVRAMTAYGVPLACGDLVEWWSAIDRLSTDADLRRRAGVAGRQFVLRNYGEDSLMRAWDAVFASI